MWNGKLKNSSYTAVQISFQHWAINKKEFKTGKGHSLSVSFIVNLIWGRWNKVSLHSVRFKAFNLTYLHGLRAGMVYIRQQICQLQKLYLWKVGWVEWPFYVRWTCGTDCKKGVWAPTCDKASLPALKCLLSTSSLIWPSYTMRATMIEKSFSSIN